MKSSGYRWAKSRDPQAVEKTRETFERMRAMYKCGNVEAQPNLVSYATLVNSISRSEQPGSAEKAEEILHQMYEEYKSGSIAVPPNARLVTSVIDSWQKSGDRNAGERAEDLLDWLLEIYEAEGIDSLQPNEYTFNSGKLTLLMCFSEGFVLKASCAACGDSHFCLGANAEVW